MQPSVCEDDDTFRYISKKYSFAHRNMIHGDCPNFTDGITNGAEWYIAKGRGVAVSTRFINHQRVVAT